MALQRPSEARKSYLNGLPKDQQADVMREAEERGIGPTDFVWLEARAAQQAAEAISTASTEAAARIMAAAAAVELTPAAATIAPEALAAMEKRLGSAVEAVVEAQQLLKAQVQPVVDVAAIEGAVEKALKPIASDLSRLRASVTRGTAPTYWTLYAMVCVGLVVGLVIDGLVQQFGVGPHQQLWLSVPGLEVIAGWSVVVAGVGALVTWFATRAR